MDQDLQCKRGVRLETQVDYCQKWINGFGNWTFRGREKEEDVNVINYNSLRELRPKIYRGLKYGKGEKDDGATIQ